MHALARLIYAWLVTTMDVNCESWWWVLFMWLWALALILQEMKKMWDSVRIWIANKLNLLDLQAALCTAIGLSMSLITAFVHGASYGCSAGADPDLGLSAHAGRLLRGTGGAHGLGQSGAAYGAG